MRIDHVPLVIGLDESGAHFDSWKTAGRIAARRAGTR